MIQFKEITAVKDPNPIYPERRVHLPVLTKAERETEEYKKWISDNWWMVDYQVFMGDKAEAQALADELYRVYNLDSNHPEIPGLIEKLRALKSKPAFKRTALETWTHGGYQLVDYCGGQEVHLCISKCLEKYSGQVLEAMCGHLSYFGEPSEVARTVTALDYCEVSLERHQYPARRRILCDLDQVGEGERLSFFQDEQFDAISICFGYKYLQHIDSVAREFRRILKPGGFLSFVEGSRHGHDHLFVRQFSQRGLRKTFREAGYKSVGIKKVQVPDWWEEDMTGILYHAEAVK